MSRNTGLWEEVALWVQEQNHIILYKLRLIIVREAFQSKKQQNLGISRKNQKSPKFRCFFDWKASLTNKLLFKKIKIKISLPSYCSVPRNFMGKFLYSKFVEKSMIFMELNIEGEKLGYKTCLKYLFQKLSTEVIQVLRMILNTSNIFLPWIMDSNVTLSLYIILFMLFCFRIQY